MSERPPHLLESTRTLLDWEEAWTWHRCSAVAEADERSVAFCDLELSLIRRELGRRQKLRHMPGAPAWPETQNLALRARLQGVKDLLPLAPFCETNGGLFRRSDSGGITRACCPLPDHHDDTPSFRIEGQRWHCFGCNRGGDVFDLAMALWGYTQLYPVLLLMEQGLGIEPPKEAVPDKPVVVLPVVRLKDGSYQELVVTS
jgi:hypothetical protein